METKTTRQIGYWLHEESTEEIKEDVEWVRVEELIKRYNAIKPPSITEKATMIYWMVNIDKLFDELSQSSGKVSKSSQFNSKSPDVPCVNECKVTTLSDSITPTSPQGSLCLCGHMEQYHTLKDDYGICACAYSSCNCAIFRRFNNAN